MSYTQPTKDEVALKLANASQGPTPQWEEFIKWVVSEIDLAYSKGYEEGHQDGADDVEED